MMRVPLTALLAAGMLGFGLAMPATPTPATAGAPARQAEELLAADKLTLKSVMRADLVSGIATLPSRTTASWRSTPPT